MSENRLTFKFSISSEFKRRYHRK